MLIFCTDYFQIWLPVVSTFMMCVSNYFSPGCVSKVSNATKNTNVGLSYTMHLSPIASS